MISRRGLLAAVGTLAAAGVRAEDLKPSYDITGAASPLALRMQATPDGRTVTQDDFRDSVTMLYFGYTFCPDVCPMVMQNAASLFDRMGEVSAQVRFLFVTVDPGRDTNAVLTDYTRAFGSQFLGLRGDQNALERLARRYRIAYSVTPSDDPRLYEVSHSDGIYIFDRQLNARLLVSSLATKTADLGGLAADLTRMVREPPSRWGWLRALV